MACLKWLKVLFDLFYKNKLLYFVLIMAHMNIKQKNIYRKLFIRVFTANFLSLFVWCLKYFFLQVEELHAVLP